MGRAQRCPDSLIEVASSIFGAFSSVHVPWPDSLEKDGGAGSSSCDGPVAHDAGRTPRGPRLNSWIVFAPLVMQHNFIAINAFTLKKRTWKCKYKTQIYKIL